MPLDKDISPDAARQQDIRLAILEGDTVRAIDLMRGQTLPDEFRDEMLNGAIAAGDHVDVIRFIIDDLKTESTPTRDVFLLNAASEKQHRKITEYMMAKALDNGVSMDDCLRRIVTHFTPETAADIVKARADKTENPAALMSDALNVATLNRAYDVLPALVDAGATLGGHTGTIMLALMSQMDPALYEDKEKYLSLFNKVAAAGAASSQPFDMMLPLVAYKIPDGTLYEEMMDTVRNAGADPFAFGQEARRSLTKSFNDSAAFDAEKKWQQWFDTAQDAYTERHRADFDARFSAGFKVADLQKTINDSGDTGLMLAARARRLDVVLSAARATDDAPLVLQDILVQNAHKQSVLSLAIDRQDLLTLLQPAYWLKKDDALLRTVEAALTDDQKKTADLAGLAADISLYKIKQHGGGRFKLAARSAP